MPYNEEKSQALEKKLSESFFRSVKEFVKVYNAGLISKKHDEVKKIAQQINETYKDVREKNGQLTFISEEEVALEEALHNLQKWTVLTKAKRIVQNAVDNDKISQESIIIANENGNFYTPIVENPENDEDFELIDYDKAFNKNDNIDELIKRSSIHTNETLESYGGYAFRASDITSIDNSFIVDIEQRIPQA